jgi:two-component system, NtrC family, sensor histidine kinase PilS
MTESSMESAGLRQASTGADQPAPGPPPSSSGAETMPALAASRLPAPRSVLKWIYGGRIALAVGSFLFIASIWNLASPGLTLTASLVLVASLGFTSVSFWYTHLAERAPGRNFLYGQAIFDLLLVTWIVHLTGGSQSAFAPLYILVICAAAILLPLLGGVLVGLLASALYVAEVVWNSQGAVAGHVVLQLLLFTVVALVTGYLGDRLRQTGAALGEVETRLELLRLSTDDILSSIRTGIITVDGGGRLAYLNPAATEILTLSPAEWLGKPVLEALNDAAPGLGWVIEQTQRDRRPIARFESGDLLEGSFVLGVSTTLMEREGEETPAVTAIFQDITQKTRIEQLERRAERLEAVAELSASLAHEIKNPLASIRSAVEQLADSRVDADDRSVLNTLVVRESGRLTRLLGEFIDFARTKITSPARLDFRALVRDVVTLVRAHPDAEERSVKLTGFESGDPIWLVGSEDLLHRAVLNLVLNAAQWAGRDGSVDVAIEIVHSDILSPVLGTHDLVRLTVADDGPGIEPSVAEHIFNPFFTRRPGGTGLGLALVQRAADAHGGIVFVDPVRGPGLSGAVFTLCLPYRVGAVEMADSESSAVAEAYP